MIGNKKVIAIIPARGGSKRLPRKNARDFLGKPLVAWAIEQARSCRYVDTVICSTEDAEIKHIAEQWRCLVLPRPRELASDTATMNDVVLHVLDHHAMHDLAVVLQPTSPLRIRSDVEIAVALEMSISVGPEGKPNGALYCVDVAMFFSFPYFGGRVFYMPAERSVDINTEDDWRKAEEYGRKITN